MVAVLSGTLILVVLLILPGLSFYYDVTPKIAVLLAGAASGLAIVAIRRPGILVGIDYRFLILLVAFWLSLVLATAFSENPAISMGGTSWRRLGLITWTGIVTFAILCAAYAVGRPDRVRLLLRAAVYAGGVAAIYGICQFFGWDPLLSAREYHVGTGEWTIVRTPGPLGHAAYFSAFLLVPVFAAIGLAWTDQSRSLRSLEWIIAIFAAVAIVLSGTRAAIISLAIGGLYLAAVSRIRPGRRALVTAVAVAILGCCFYFSPAGQKLRSRTRWYVEDPFGGARPLMWRDSLWMSAAHPHLGVGPEMYSSRFPRSQSAELARRFPDFHHESPHNIFIDALAGQGVPGAFLLAVLAAFGGIAAWKARRLHSELAATLGACWLALIVTHQFTSFVAPTALYFFCVLAFIVALLPQRGNKGVRLAYVLPVRIVSMGVAVILLTFSAQLVFADRLLERVKQAVTAQHLAEARHLYQQVTRIQPIGMSADLWYSRSMAAAAQNSATLVVRFEAWQDAMQAAVRATRNSEVPHNAWYSLATLAAAQNDAPLTEHALRNAIAASPNWYKPRWALAGLLHVTGRQKEAEAQIALALDRNGGKHSEVTDTAQRIRLSVETRR